MHEYTADHSGSLAVEQEEFISYCGLYDYVIQQTPASNWFFFFVHREPFKLRAMAMFTLRTDNVNDT